MTAKGKRRSERLLARMSRLAQEKSNLQLVNNLMCSLGGIAGLDNIVDRMLHLLSEHGGGHNIALYYALENTTFYADVYGEKHVVEKIDDEMVRQAFETGLPVEETRACSNRCCSTCSTMRRNMAAKVRHQSMPGLKATMSSSASRTKVRA